MEEGSEAVVEESNRAEGRSSNSLLPPSSCYSPCCWKLSWTGIHNFFPFAVLLSPAAECPASSYFKFGVAVALRSCWAALFCWCLSSSLQLSSGFCSFSLSCCSILSSCCCNRLQWAVLLCCLLPWQLHFALCSAWFCVSLLLSVLLIRSWFNSPFAARSFAVLWLCFFI